MKGTKLALTDFLADGSSSSPGPVKTDWAAEMDHTDMEGACYLQFEIELHCQFGGVMVIMLASRAGRSWVRALIGSNQRL